MKKLMSKILCIVLIISSLLSVAVGCADNGNQGERNEDIYAVYNTYVAYAESNGEIPLTYQAWLAELQEEYHILGGKTGTTTIYNFVGVFEDLETGKRFVAAVSGGDTETGDLEASKYDTKTNNRFTNMKTLLDIGARLIENKDADISDLEEALMFERACIVVLPENGKAFNSYDFFNKPNPYFLYSKNGTVQMPFASTMKIMTASTALDYIYDLNDTLVIKSSDIAGGSGPDLQPGEVYTFRDALHAMFLPSSNTMCQALARTLGEKIYKINNNLI